MAPLRDIAMLLATHDIYLIFGSPQRLICCLMIYLVSDFEKSLTHTHSWDT